MKKDAIISQDEKYRYLLTRIWDENLPFAVFIMLNPSTADSEKDDPTIRRCINFAKCWGYGGIKVVNIFAYRATDPKELSKVTYPIGCENGHYIQNAVINAGVIIAAWGATFKDGHEAFRILRGILKEKRVYCLGITKEGYPRHPLYVKNNTKLELWESGFMERRSKP